MVGVDYCAAAIKLAKQAKFVIPLKIYYFTKYPNTKYILAHNQAVPQIKASHPNFYSQVAEQADLDLDFQVWPTFWMFRLRLSQATWKTGMYFLGYSPNTNDSNESLSAVHSDTALWCWNQRKKNKSCQCNQYTLSKLIKMILGVWHPGGAEHISMYSTKEDVWCCCRQGWLSWTVPAVNTNCPSVAQLYFNEQDIVWFLLISIDFCHWFYRIL